MKFCNFPYNGMKIYTCFWILCDHFWQSTAFFDLALHFLLFKAVSATSPTSLDRVFWKCACVLAMIWKCACGLGFLIRLFFTVAAFSDFGFPFAKPVSAIPSTFVGYFWNFAGFLAMVCGCACILFWFFCCYQAIYTWVTALFDLEFPFFKVIPVIPPTSFNIFLRNVHLSYLHPFSGRRVMEMFSRRVKVSRPPFITWETKFVTSSCFPIHKLSSVMGRICVKWETKIFCQSCLLWKCIRPRCYKTFFMLS